MNLYNALSTVQHSFAAKKFHMNNFINFLYKTIDEFFYPLPWNNTNINKSVELSMSTEDAFTE